MKGLYQPEAKDRTARDESNQSDPNPEVTLPECGYCGRGFLTDQQCKSHEARCDENDAEEN